MATPMLAGTRSTSSYVERKGDSPQSTHTGRGKEAPTILKEFYAKLPQTPVALRARCERTQAVFAVTCEEDRINANEETTLELKAKAAKHLY